jgi:drug/metabolite transporter (DMT)-like permease
LGGVDAAGEESWFVCLYSSPFPIPSSPFNYGLSHLQPAESSAATIPSPRLSSASTLQSSRWQKLTRIPQTAYYIAFGAHGPRALPPPGEGWKVAGYTAVGILASFLLFVGIRMGAKGSPPTMNKEYQEATNEYLKVWLYPPSTYISFFAGFGEWERMRMFGNFKRQRNEGDEETVDFRRGIC